MENPAGGCGPAMCAHPFRFAVQCGLTGIVECGHNVETNLARPLDEMSPRQNLPHVTGQQLLRYKEGEINSTRFVTPGTTQRAAVCLYLNV